MTSNSDGRATRITLFSFNTPPMRAFHMAWLAFFVCFFAWFSTAPLMAVVRRELQLTQAQVGHLLIASVASTIVARLLVGWLCDRVGPRLSYTALLILGAFPVAGIGLAQDYETFLLFRLAVGVVGASFVITQCHTSAMFAGNCIGTANATTAGWGNMGGGMAQIAMPMLVAALLEAGVGEFWGWRLAMVVPGAAMFVMGAAYYLLTQDSPEDRPPARGEIRTVARHKSDGPLLHTYADPRVWALAVAYAACFGVEITIHGMASLYLMDRFDAGLRTAGLVVGCFGLLALFARTIGGWLSDRVARSAGLPGRLLLLSGALLGEGVTLTLFSRCGSLWLAAAAMILFGLFVHLSSGATYAVVPFVRPKAVGSASGIVGAGGSLGAVASGFLLTSSLPWSTCLLIMGLAVTTCSFLLLFVRLSDADRPTDEAMDRVAGTAVAVSA